MQRAEHSSPRAVPEVERSGLQPTTAFVLLLLVAAAVAALFFLTRPTPAPEPTGTKTATEPSFALTNNEAIARFKELQLAHLSAYEATDFSLLSQVLTDNSVIGMTIRQEVQQLAKDRVSARFTYETRSLEVIENAEEEITIRQVAIVDSSFYSKDGTEVTSRGRPELQEIVWTLRLQGSAWLIHDAVIMEATPIGSDV